MQSRMFAAFLLTTLMLSPLAAATPVLAEDGKRVVAHTQAEVSSAIAEGCTVLREVKELTALNCPENSAAAEKLQDDVRVFAMDAGANTQVRADLVHAGGNTGTGRKAVVLDTGYNYLHPELSSSYLGGKDFVNNDDDAMDDNGHGSHVAGLITADGVQSRAKGVAPNAGVIAGKVLDAGGRGFFSDVAAAIYWAVDGPDGIAGPVCTTDNSTSQTTCTNDDFNADVISMSLGTSTPYVYKGYCDSVLPDLTNAIAYAVSRGVNVVAASGNNGNPGVSIPGCISYSTTVGAVDSRDRIASFSGRGGAVDITAPGVSLYSCWLGTGYATASGTSMATPVVTGTVALIKAAKPAYTPAQVENALFKTAKDLGKKGKDTSYGWGRVDAYAAVNFNG